MRMMIWLKWVHVICVCISDPAPRRCLGSSSSDERWHCVWRDGYKIGRMGDGKLVIEVSRDACCINFVYFRVSVNSRDLNAILYNSLLKKISRVLDWADHKSGSPQVFCNNFTSCFKAVLVPPFIANDVTILVLHLEHFEDLLQGTWETGRPWSWFSQVLENLVIWMKLGPNGFWWLRGWSIWS